jgi:hypothetical protein
LVTRDVVAVFERPFVGSILTSLVVLIEYVVAAAVVIPASEARVLLGGKIGVKGLE